MLPWKNKDVQHMQFHRVLETQRFIEFPFKKEFHRVVPTTPVQLVTKHLFRSSIHSGRHIPIRRISTRMDYITQSSTGILDAGVLQPYKQRQNYRIRIRRHLPETHQIKQIDSSQNYHRCTLNPDLGETKDHMGNTCLPKSKSHSQT